MYEYLQSLSFLVMYVVNNNSKHEKKYGAPKSDYRRKRINLKEKHIHLNYFYVALRKL